MAKMSFREPKPKGSNPLRLKGGSLKLYNYFKAVLSSPKFQNEIQKIRKDYCIPPTGFQKPLNRFENPDPVKIVLEPREIVEARTRARNLAKAYELDRAVYPHPFEEYLFYNQIDEDEYEHWEDVWTLCWVTDNKRIEETKKVPQLAIYDKLFPVLLQISPYATENDIVRFVKENFQTSIKKRQEKFQSPEIKLGKIKSKNADVEERNALIRKNKDLPIKEISKILSKAGYSMDQGYISKVRAEARKDL